MLSDAANSPPGARPRLHLIRFDRLRAGRFHGLLAPNAKLRCEIIPSPADHATEHSTNHAQTQGASARLSWARLLKRAFDIDIAHCPNCGGTLKIIAAIEDPPVIVRILTHLSLPTAPRFAPFHRDSIYSKRPESRNRLPTQADDAARSEFERALRRGTNQAVPTAASPEPAEARPQFSPNTRAIDYSPVRRYWSGQKKGGLNFLSFKLARSR
jgi:hypothetical protein